VISSAGRTVYEVVSQARPIITICQNIRETDHYFGDENITLNLGLHSEIEDTEILASVMALISDHKKRRSLINMKVARRLRENKNHLIKLIKDFL
jgi:spore coat polysaccharide biosynthesis predicted glycosyltransferase SpsG